MEPVVGFEPTTDGLQNRCSTTELNWQTKRAQLFLQPDKPTPLLDAVGMIAAAQGDDKFQFALKQGAL